MTRYRQTMTFTIDIEADSTEQATRIAQEHYDAWDFTLCWNPDTTVIVPDDDEDFYPVNEDLEDN